MSTTARINNGVTAQGLHAKPIEQDYQVPAYASTLAVSTYAQYTLVTPVVAGPISITANVTKPLIGDILEFNFVDDGSGETITFSTGFATTAPTLVLPTSGEGLIQFGFTANQLWAEKWRSLPTS